jgi:tRNA-specific 2-thiouridylase
MAKIAVALSGGIDSLAAARILKQQGHDLVGLHFLTGYENIQAEVIREMGGRLGLSVEIVDLREAFKTAVIDDFVSAYAAGRTPNPCLRCNPEIKFGRLLDYAIKLGSEFLATGHYARTDKDNRGRVRLFKGADMQKDQSYFLAFLTPDQLQHACFPLGRMSKESVRKLAAENHMVPAIEQESQDVCFIRTGYADFLENRPGFTVQPGPITDISGKTIGRHSGLHRFTIGQRRGINCPAPEPYYVVRLDAENNRLIVGGKADLLCSRFTVSGLQWLFPSPENPLRVQVRVRYRHKAVDATVCCTEDNRAEVILDVPHPAVTPGQGAVFYCNDEVLGGGWIE